MGVWIILNQMLILFFFILLGFILNKGNIINEDFNRRITKIIIYMTMPCMILTSVLEQEGARDMKALGTVSVVAVITYLAVPILAFVLVYLFPVRVEYKGIYMFMTIYSNVGFMGFPVLNALYGVKTVFYAAIFNIVFNVSMFTYGVMLMHYKRKSAAGALQWKALLSPGISLSIFAVIVYIFQIPFPGFLASAVSSLGNMTVPLAMMVIGATLGTMRWKELVDDRNVYAYMLFRQFILPLMALPILELCIHDELILAVSFILLMMPIANTSVLFANLYDNDTKLAAKGVFFTTLLSIASIPLLTWIFL